MMKTKGKFTLYDCYILVNEIRIVKTAMHITICLTVLSFMTP